MTLNSQIKTINVLNIDDEESTITAEDLLDSDVLDATSYILSDADEEIIILVEFKCNVNLQSIILFALSETESNEDISGPKRVHIYFIDNLSKDFDDIKSMKPQKSIKCSNKKLSKGQTTNLQKSTANSIKFKKIKYLAIYIESNQNDSEKTYLNALTFKGTSHKNAENIDFLNVAKSMDDDNDNAFFDHLRNAFKNSSSSCSGSVSVCSYLNRLSNNIYNDNVYDILDDYLHLLSHHNDTNDIEYIYNKLGGNCDIKTCAMFKRNYRNRSEYKSNHTSMDTEERVNLQIADRVHCFYCHSYDIGYRITTRERFIINNIEEDQNEDYCNCFVNKQRKKLKDLLSKKHDLYRKLGGLRRITKFNELRFYNNNIEEKKETYETEQIYSFGFDYRYKQWEDDMRWKTLYFIENKYSSLKKEVIENKFVLINIEQFNNEYRKAAKHFSTNHAKRVMNNLDPKTRIRFELGKISVSVDHFLVLLFYCNYDHLQYEFSKTYRKESVQESYKSVIKRHQNFYWFGMYLKQFIHWFGVRPQSSNAKKVYHGINQTMLLPFGHTNDIFGHYEYASVRIMCPLSTSSSFEVAINFAGKEGIIVEVGDFDISKYHKFTMTTTKHFACNWLSDFGNEKEFLFIQNKEIFMINNITEAASGIEYKFILQTINILECYVHNAEPTAEPTIPESMKILIVRIVENELSNIFPNKYLKFQSLTDYACKLLHYYRVNKKTYKLNWFRNKDYEGLKKIFAHNQWINIVLLNHFYPNLKTFSFDAKYCCDDILDNILFYFKNNCKWMTIQTILIYQFGDEMSGQYQQKFNSLNVSAEFDKQSLKLIHNHF